MIKTRHIKLGPFATQHHCFLFNKLWTTVKQAGRQALGQLAGIPSKHQELQSSWPCFPTPGFSSSSLDWPSYWPQLLTGGLGVCVCAGWMPGGRRAGCSCSSSAQPTAAAAAARSVSCRAGAVAERVRAGRLPAAEAAGSRRHSGWQHWQPAQLVWCSGVGAGLWWWYCWHVHGAGWSTGV